MDNYWLSLDDYVNIFQRQGTGTNVVSLIGHTTVRAAVVGNEDRAPSAVELERTVGYVEEAMETGCGGLASGVDDYTYAGLTIWCQNKRWNVKVWLR